MNENEIKGGAIDGERFILVSRTTSGAAIIWISGEGVRLLGPGAANVATVPYSLHFAVRAPRWGYEAAQRLAEKLNAQFKWARFRPERCPLA
jgi:hypothetical protein